MVARKQEQGWAIILGGFASGAALCACLTLVVGLYFLLAIFTIDEYATAWSEYGYDLTLGAALTVTFCCSAWFGWRVARDWLRMREESAPSVRT
jgi:hypothetical protein